MPGDGVGERRNAVCVGPPAHSKDGNNGRVCVDAHELGVEHVRRAVGPGDVLAGHPDKNGGVRRRPASDGERNPRSTRLTGGQRYTIAAAQRRMVSAGSWMSPGFWASFVRRTRLCWLSVLAKNEYDLKLPE